MSGRPKLPTADVERVMPAPPHEVYDAWLDEAALLEFICPAPGRAAAVSVDPWVGGGYRFLMALPDRELVVSGEYLALDHPERITFTWRCSDTGDLQSVVTVTFAPHEGHETLMRISHSLLPAAAVERHVEGWRLVAAQLAGLRRRPAETGLARPAR